MKTRPGACLILPLLGVAWAAAPAHAQEPWKATLSRELPLMGYHNWIVIADAAYPWQTSPGVETVATGADPLVVVRAVLDAFGKTRQVVPAVFEDAELPFVAAQDAPAITAYRDALSRTMGPLPIQTLLNEQLISTVAEAGQSYHVLVLKTKGTLPYSSLFIQVKAAYWNPDAEMRLRSTMPPAAATAGATAATDGAGNGGAAATPPMATPGATAPGAAGPGFGPWDGGPRPPFAPRPRGRGRGDR